MTSDYTSLLTHTFEDHDKLGIDFMPAWRKILEEDIDVCFYKDGDTIAFWERFKHNGEPAGKVWYARGNLQTLYDLFKDLTWLYFERNIPPHRGTCTWFHRKHLLKYGRLIQNTKSTKDSRPCTSGSSAEHPGSDQAIGQECHNDFSSVYGRPAIYESKENNICGGR